MSLRAALVVTAATIVVVGACSSPPRRDYRGEFEAWQAAGIDDYDLTLDVEDPAGGPRSLTVDVRDGRPVRALLDGEPTPLKEGAVRGLTSTVDELFELLIEAEDADFLEMRWNADPTYPAWIHVDFHTDTFDDELTIEVVKFQVRGQGSRSSP